MLLSLSFPWHVISKMMYDTWSSGSIEIRKRADRCRNICVCQKRRSELIVPSRAVNDAWPLDRATLCTQIKKKRHEKSFAIIKPEFNLFLLLFNRAL
jgi:hypothetical protein